MELLPQEITEPELKKIYDPNGNLIFEGPIGEEHSALSQYLKKDKTYQGYTEKLAQIDSMMKKIEDQCGVTRGELLDIFKIPKGKIRDSYEKASLYYDMYAPMLKEYETEMSTWKDGSLGENSYIIHNYDKYTNLEKITLTNGQHAYRATHNGERAVFYPYWDGTCGGPKVEDESLIPKN